jgi:hypothetical protein
MIQGRMERGSVMERFLQNASSSQGSNVNLYSTPLDLTKERIRKRIRQNKHARLREMPSTAEIVGCIAAIILVIAVCALGVSQ